MSATTTLIGYWSDGLGSVAVDVSLGNEGDLPVDGVRTVTVECSPRVPGCTQSADIRMEDGFGPVPAQFELRLPMGRTSLEFNYGVDKPLRLAVAVPERIVGVERAAWECYADRPGMHVPNAFQDDNDGCGGWEATTVEKWLNDVPVKVWAAGDPRYIDILDEVLSELSPLLNIEFRWVDAEYMADLKAFVGISRAERARYGFDVGYDYYVDYAGFGGARVTNGEALSGHLVVWLRASDEWEPKDRDRVKHTMIHEVLHAMGPIGHSTRIGSIVSYSSDLKKLSPMDRALIRLNSHDLVKPGMTMAQVRSLVVFREDLLDAATFRPEPNAHDLLWSATLSLWKSGWTRFKIRGGWTERRCGQTFGVRRGLATLDLGNFGYIPYGGSYLARFSDHGDAFWMKWDRDASEWRYWREGPEGVEAIDADVIFDASAWRTSPSRFPRMLASVLNDADAGDIAVVSRGRGVITLRVTLDASYPTYWLEDREKTELTLVLDDETYEIEGYSLVYRRGWDSQWCDNYEEHAESVELGILVNVPSEIGLNVFK